jgi:UDP-3-O-[3-hydroxymyristoyl] glucosamine N-acyltransferase
MKARVLAAALDGRVIGATDAETSRAVHPAEASCEGEVATAVSPDTIRILGDSRAKIALVPEGAQFPHQRFQTVIVMRGSRSSLPEITHVFRHR